MDPSRTDSTRYLCAAAYLDKPFRDQAIAELLEDRHRAVATMPGVGIATVLKHCLAARRRKTVRDLILTGLAVVGAFIALRAEEPTVVVPFVLAAWLVVSWERWATTYGIVAKRLSRRSFDPGSVEASGNPDVRTALKRLASVQEGNVMVSGGFSPFPGCGLDIGGWSLVVDLQKGKEDIQGRLQPQAVAVEDLYTQAANAVTGLGLERVEINDKLCVNGQDLRDDPRFLPDPYGRPVAWVDSVVVKEFVVNPTQSVRHYKSIRVIDWSGELVLSVFLRFSKIAQKLFVETSYFLLTPVRERFHQTDWLNPKPTVRQWLSLLVESAVLSPFLVALSPLFIVGKLLHRWDLWNRRGQTRRSIAENRAFNYGPTSSIREAASDKVYRRYFQKLDKEMYVKMLERSILDSTIDFLEAKNVDISDLKERKTTILNSGVIVSGGSIEAKSLAVGQRARALVTRVRTAGAPKGAPVTL